MVLSSWFIVLDEGGPRIGTVPLRLHYANAAFRSGNGANPWSDLIQEQ